MHAGASCLLAGNQASHAHTCPWSHQAPRLRPHLWKQTPSSVVAAKRISDKPPVVLPGEDPDPLRWVRKTRDLAEQTDVSVAPPRPRRLSEPDGRDDDSSGSSKQQQQQQTPDAQQERGPEGEEPPAEQSACAPRKRKQHVGPQEVRKLLRQQMDLEGILFMCEQVWPEWAANGCRLLDLRGSSRGKVKGPTVAEAASALRVAATRALESMSGGERLIQARDRRIIGLIEALRVVPARPPPSERRWEDDEGEFEAFDRAEAKWDPERRQESARSSGADTAGSSPTAILTGAPADGSTDGPAAAAHTAAADTAAADTVADTAGSDGATEGIAGTPGGSRGAAAKKGVAVMHPTGLTDAVWSLAVFGGPVLFEQEMEVLISGADLRTSNASRWKAKTVADLLWGLALSHHWTTRLPELEALVVQMGGIAAFTGREAVSCLWAFATLCHLPEALLADIDAKGWRFEHPRPRPGLEPKGLDGLSPKQLAAIAWALAALEAVKRPVFQMVWEEIGTRGWAGMTADGPLQRKTLMQLHQVAWSVDLEGNGRHPGGEGMAQLIQEAACTWENHVKPVHQRNESFYEGQIASTLVALGRFHCREDVTSGYAVDLSLPEERIAIEADGPSHMARNRSGQLLGHTQMKHRHLQRLGWKVLPVEWVDWDELMGSREKQQYLQDRLKQLEVGA